MKHDPSDPAMWAKPKRKQTSTWKSVERKIARLFGAERNQDTHGYDFLSDFFIVEVKHRDTLPKWIEDAMLQVETAAVEIESDPLPVAILHAKGQRFDAAYAIVRVSNMVRIHDFMNMYAQLSEEPK